MHVSIKKYIFPILLALISILLFITNYKNNTYLIGWDNIMPEFNLGLNLKRSLIEVWQNNKGLGLMGGQSYETNLVYIIFTWILSLVFSTNIIRYIATIYLHFLGGLSFYYLGKKLTKNSSASFLGALFYLFNIGTIQQFFAPLETFSFHFVTLPLLALTITLALEQPTKKNLLFLFISALLTTPQSFVPTFFIVSFILFLFIFIKHWLTTKKIKPILMVITLIIIANSFWLLPYLQGLNYNVNIIPKTRINEFSSEEVFYRNQAFGDILSVLTLKGFMMDTVDYNNLTRTNDYFMKPWREHVNSIVYQIIFITIFFIGLFGIFEALKSKKKEFFPYIAGLIVAFFFLANNTLVIREINNFLRNSFPVFGEIFRIPFTKFIILYVFCFSLFLNLGLVTIINKLRKFKFLVIITISLSLFYLAYPAFKGNFISPLLKVNLPKYYLEMMAYLNKQDENQRIALLPTATFWNWQYRNWGQRGSDFLWYGIKQPILMRPFDPWSNYNEQFYNEISYAIKTNNKQLFINVIDKYDISYLLLDKTIINNISTKPINYEQLIQFIDSVSSIKQDKVFGDLSLYKKISPNSPLYQLPENMPSLNLTFFYNDQDQIYNQFGNYINQDNGNIFYPFASLYTGKLQSDNNFDAVEEKNEIIITPKQSINLINPQTLYLPSLFQTEHLIPANINVKNGFLIIQPIYPRIYIDNQLVPIQEKSFVIPIHKVFNPTTINLLDLNQEIKPGESSYIQNKFINTIELKDSFNTETIQIDTQNIIRENFVAQISGQIKNVRLEFNKIIGPLTYENIITNKQYKTLPKTDKSFELISWLPNLFHQGSYIIFANTSYQSGLPINFYIDNPFEKRAEIDTRLSKLNGNNVLVLPKTEDYYQGYGLHFIIKSVGNELASSKINEVSLYPIPLETISNIYFTSSESIIKVNKQPITWNKTASYLYTINGANNNGIIVLSQAFNPDWKAYETKCQSSNVKCQIEKALPFLFIKEIKEHVLVNNWANGWALRPAVRDSAPQGKNIVIIFWPQYLEFLGFGLILITLVLIIITPSIKKDLG